MAIAKSQWDAIIIGAGGSGLRAAYSLSESGFKTAVLSKVFPTRSHTVSAQGGITAAVPNSDENDDWRYHMYDTVKGADYIGDQDCIEYMCKTGPEVVYEMENMGMPFSRMDNGRIYQRPFGGQTKNYGQGQAARTCAAADRTGHALLHTLYQQNLKVKTTFFSEWYVLDFVKDNAGKVVGVTAICIESGEVVFFQSRVCILATGGAGRIYQSTTNALINTGDGFGMALRAGLPLQDMEMWQFHPTGIAGSGVLVSESCRGEGGFLVNKDGERFMERYAPHVKDLACRDVVARSIALEIKAGKGCDPNGVDHVKLKLDHLGADLIKSRLPGIRELSMTFAGVDPIVEPIPVVPTCHYVMGGIPTNRHSQVLTLNANGDETPVDGLYAVGECACVSVHGANRLGGNSLLDLLVFGRAAGLHIGELMQNGGLPSLGYVSNEEIDQSLSRYRRWETSGSSNNATDPNVIYSEMQKIMQNSFGVFRTGEIMADGLKQLNALREQLQYAALKDKSRVFNTARISALELDNLLATACATALSALTRTESRGAHTRDDFPERDDVNWIKHTLYFAGEDKHSDKMAFRPVNNKPLYVPAFEPIERIY